MDLSAEEIVFDANGVCNFCHRAQEELALARKNRRHLLPLLGRMKRAGEGKQYDCLIGLSGGVDSSLTLHWAVKMGLRPLCFSVDNGWNTKEADENIMRLVETLRVPFYRYTIDIRRFRELQAAFLKAGLRNIEIPADHVLMATTYEMAAKYGIKYIVHGGNVATESIMPASWGYSARDLTHMRAVYRAMTGKPLRGLPTCSVWRWNYYRWVHGIKMVPLLDMGFGPNIYLEYNRAEAVALLSKEYGYKEYGEKHCESTFTWWFQNFYLFEKFGIDKRRAHYSSLINSGQMTREEALAALQKAPVYPKLGLEIRALSYPKRRHEDFPQDKWYPLISRVVRTLSWKS